MTDYTPSSSILKPSTSVQEDETTQEGDNQTDSQIMLKRTTIAPVEKLSIYCDVDNVCFLPGEIPIMMFGGLPRTDPCLTNYLFGIYDGAYDEKTELYTLNFYKKAKLKQNIDRQYEKVKYFMEKNPTKLPIDKNKIPLFFTRYKEFIENLEAHKDDLTQSKIYQYFLKRSKDCEKRKNNILAKFSCGFQKIRYVDGTFSMVSMGANSKLNNLFGWGKEKFMNQIFSKGIPEYTCMQDMVNSKFLDAPANYMFNLNSKNPYRCAPFFVSCYIKEGFVTPAICKTIIFEVCNGPDDFGYDILIPILGLDGDYSEAYTKNSDHLIYNQDFLNEVLEKEKNWNKLLKTYKKFQPVTNYQDELKTCRIKGIEASTQPK